MAVIHDTPHPLAGKTVMIKRAGTDEEEMPFHVEDWWDRINGESWMTSDGNFAAINYALRCGTSGLPIDNQVVYGKIGHLGHIVHESEMITEKAAQEAL